RSDRLAQCRPVAGPAPRRSALRRPRASRRLAREGSASLAVTPVPVKYRRRRCQTRWSARSLILGAILIAVVHSEVFAQTAQLSGRITDATAAVLRGAVVTVTQAT